MTDEVVVTAEAVAQAPDGETLYNENCDVCHESFADAPNWTTPQIEEAIDQNVGGMGFIDLTTEEIEAIADALTGRL